MKDVANTSKRIEEWIAKAEGTALTRGGISSLASRLPLEDADLAEAVEMLHERYDGRTLAALLLSHGANGRTLPASLVGPTLYLLPSPTELIAVLGCTEGDLVDMLLCAVESGRMSVERDAIALWFAAYLSKEGPVDERLPALLRSRLRVPPSAETVYLLASAAEQLDDEHLNAAAMPYIALLKSKTRGDDAGLFEKFSSTFDKPVLEMLPKREVEEAPVRPFTVRRAMEKVGRNDPCPCGSGKKYKKCCQGKDQERLANPSPVPGVTMDVYLENAHKYMTHAELGELRPHDIARLPLDEFSTHQLITAKDKFSLYHMWDQAERALDLLAERSDLPGLIDEYRYDLIFEAVSNNEKPLFLRQTAKVRDPAVLEDLRVQRALMMPDERSLEVLNAEVERNLKSGNDTSTIDMAKWLMDIYPGFGLVFARGVLSAERPWDSDMLVENIEKARDKLLLSIGDPATEYYEFLLDRSVDRRLMRMYEKSRDEQITELTEKTESLQQDLKAATQRSATLAEELAEKMRELEALDAQTKSAAPSTPVSNGAAAPGPARRTSAVSDEASKVARLRKKVTELKAYIEDSRDEKSRLRKELSKMGEDFEKLSAVKDVSASEMPLDEDHFEEETSLPAYKEPLIPVFEKSATHTMAELPRSVVAQGIKTAAAVAVGDQTGGLKVARVRTLKELWSARIGIHHRMLFRISDAPQKELRVQALIHRRDLESTLKKLRGTEGKS